MLKSWLLAAVGLAGCSAGAAGSAAAPAMPMVVTRTIDATAAQCPFGGSVVETGLDVDGDGVLSDAEVQTQTVVCQMPTPLALTVVRLAAEPAGAHCTLGGTAVESGLDRNGNGVLDAGEITQIVYVCSGLLVSRMVSEPPGVHCAAGGIAIVLGTDRNGNGVLDDDEILQTEYACGDVVTGDAVVHDAQDLAALASVVEITGALIIDHPGVAAIALPDLAHADSVQISDDTATQLSMPVLLEVTGGLTISDSAQLSQLALPLLARAGSFVVQDNPQLPACAVDALFTRVAGDHQQAGNDDAATCAQGGTP